MIVELPIWLEERLGVLERLPIAHSLPAPWVPKGVVEIDGLSNVGFADSSDMLMCVADGGRYVVDCIEGTLVASDDNPVFEFDHNNLKIKGFGPLAGVEIRTSGGIGGALRTVAHDGWSVEAHPVAYPKLLFVTPPGQSMLTGPPKEQETSLTKLRASEISSATVAYGFSPTGRSFVVATNEGLHIFARD